MTKEKYLELVNKAIGNLKDSDDSYGTTPIDFMRKSGIKSTDRMCFFLDGVGAYLEEIRCALLTDIETESAKASGKSSILSNVKKFGKKCKALENQKPQFAYANYDEVDQKYWLSDGYCLLVSENSDGMELIPERVKNDIVTPYNYKRNIPDLTTYTTFTLPPIGKISAVLKQKKSVKLKHDNDWKRLVFEQFAVNGEYLEMFMRITGSSEIYYKDDKHALYMEGNGYQAVIMPTKPYYTDKDTGEQKRYELTDFDSI